MQQGYQDDIRMGTNGVEAEPGYHSYAHENSTGLLYPSHQSKEQLLIGAIVL